MKILPDKIDQYRSCVYLFNVNDAVLVVNSTNALKAMLSKV